MAEVKKFSEEEIDLAVELRTVKEALIIASDEARRVPGLQREVGRLRESIAKGKLQNERLRHTQGELRQRISDLEAEKRTLDRLQEEVNSAALGQRNALDRVAALEDRLIEAEEVMNAEREIREASEAEIASLAKYKDRIEMLQGEGVIK
jgi:chromosome segregation ATPase